MEQISVDRAQEVHFLAQVSRTLRVIIQLLFPVDCLTLS